LSERPAGLHPLAAEEPMAHYRYHYVPIFEASRGLTVYFFVVGAGALLGLPTEM
jgi:hypothetical protein